MLHSTSDCGCSASALKDCPVVVVDEGIDDDDKEQQGLNSDDPPEREGVVESGDMGVLNDGEPVAVVIAVAGGKLELLRCWTMRQMWASNSGNMLSTWWKSFFRSTNKSQ